MEKRKVIMILGFLSLILGTCVNISMAYASTSVSATVVAGSSNGNVYVYNEVGDLLWSYYTGADVASVAMSSDGAYIAVGSLGNKLYLFTREGTKLWEKTVPISSGYGGGWMGTESRSVAMSAYGEYIVAGCTDNLYVYKKDGTLHWSHTGRETCVDISPNGTYIVSCNNNDGTIHFFSTQSSIPLWTKSISAYWVATSNLGYVAASSHSTVYLYNSAGTQVWSYHHSKWDSDYIRVDMPQDGLGVVAVNDDPSNYPGCVLCYWNHLKDGTLGWSSADSTPVWVFEPGGGPGDTDLYSVVISGNGDIIATGSFVGSFVFSRTSNVPLQSFSMGTGQSYDLTFDGQYGACGNRQGGFYYFSKDSGTPLWSKTIGGMVHAVAVAYLEEWPMFHHDLRHTGYSTSIAPNTNNSLWIYTTSAPVWSSPAVAGDRVYVGSDDGKIYCLNASSGAHIWNYTTGHDLMWSSPAVAGDRVYVGSYDNKTYCLNALTGEHIWNYTTGDVVYSSPAVAGDRVYVGSTDNKTYCLNATSGAHIWNYTTGDWISSSPAVVDDNVYVGSGDHKVYCLNATTGEHIWNYTTGNWVESSPAVVENVVFIGSDDNKIYALNATTGAHIWNYTTEDWVVSSPAVADGRVYVGSEDKKVRCLNATTGAHIWNYTTGLMVRSSPAVADGKVYVGSLDHNVYCLNASSGALIWRYTTGGQVVSSPAIADGKVFVGSEDTKVYAFEDPIYTLSITTSDGGTTNPVPGTHTYRVGTTVTVTAIPNTNYEFNHWELDGSWNYSNPIIIAMDSNYTLHAVFTYNVTAKAHCYTEDAAISVNITMDGSPSGYTTPHTFINLTGTHTFTVPDKDPSGHLFKQWNTGETSTTITVSSNGTYTAYYQAKWNLSITTTTGGTTNPAPGTYSYWDGTEVQVTALPSLGYILDYWELDEINVGAPNPITVTMNSNHTLHALFLWKGICNLTISATTGGTTNPAPRTYSYTNGTVVSVTAMPPSLGYVFDHWELDGANVGAPNPISVTMNQNHTLHAVFTWVGICHLTITTTQGGTTSPTPGTHSYTNGTTVTVTATPYAHYEFNHWELDGSWNYSNPINVIMRTNHTLHAVFTYTVTIRAYCYAEGKEVSVSIIMDGSPTGYTTPHAFTGLTGTHTFTVPSTDAGGHQFKQWSTGSTSTTITITSGGWYTAYYEAPPPPPGVGGVVISVDKFGLLAPYIGLASTILVATVATSIYVKRVKHRKEKQ